ncbi:MAG: hypothetical protein QG598_778 [Bacillota bacterium]|nr:hypothetical protein [Bacillota bacterium]
MKVYKKILSILLLVILSFNTVIALETRSAKIEYLGKVTSSTGSTVGRFKVNGQWAFCVDHAKTSHPSNTSYDSGSIYNNESIRAILYYGYGGIGNEIGTSNDAWVATTLALDSVMNNNDSAYRRKIPGYSILMDHAQKKDAPSTDASFSKSSVTSSVSGDRQVSETITFNADYRNSITLAVQSGTTIVVDGKSYTNGNVTINGGQSFYITAPLDYSNNVVYSNIKPSLKIYQSILYMPTSSKYQRLGQGMEQDPPPIQNLSVEFKARQRNITVLHKNRHDGSILLQENDKKNICSNYTYYPKNPLYKDGTTFIPESTNSKSGTVPNQDLTIEFWYNAQQNITIQHIDNRDGSIISQENEKKNRGEQYSYSPKNDLKKGDYTYRPISNQVQSGTVGNSDITIKFYYDVPLIKAGLKKIQIYTEQADKGLPVKVEIDKKYIYDENIADMSNSKIKLGLYDNSNNEVISKEFTAKTLPEMLDMTIPSTKLKKDSSKSYTLKIEGYDSNMVDVISNAMSLTTDGYTSSEKIIKVDSSKQDNLSYRGVVMTEREVGKNMKVYYETLDIPLERIKRMRTGYGFEVPLDLTYINEIGSNDLDFSFDFKAQDEIVDKSYIEYSSKNGVSTVALENTSKKSSTNNNVTISKQKFELQHINVEKRTGALFNDNQVNNQDSRIQYDLIDGGRKFYLPIWARIGDYQANVESTKDIGINKINVEIGYDINIYAHMYAHMDSESILDDAIILEPIDSDNPFPNGIPKGWTKENLDALNEMLDEKLNKGNLSMSSIFGKKK